MPAGSSDEAAGSYRELDSQQVIRTIAALQTRISERFAGSGLAKVCGELRDIAAVNSDRARRIAAPNVALRIAIIIILAAGAAALAWIAWLLKVAPPEGNF